MMDNIQKEINGFYARYASKEGITLSEAKKRVSDLDIEAYGRKAKRYVESKTFSKEANEEMRLYNATMKINRLEMLKANIGLELVSGFDELQQFFDTTLTDRTLSEFERQAGILGKSVLNNEKAAHSIVNASFQNATFSNRIWMYQDMLKAELASQLKIGLVQGRNPRELARHISKVFGVSRSNAERLMQTELARVQTEAQKQSYERNGYDEYVFIAEPTACPICRVLDDKVFKVTKMMPGENASPMHPHCRCSTAAHMDRQEFDKWLDWIDKGGTTDEWERLRNSENINHRLMDSTDKWAKEARKELLKSEKSLGRRSKEIMEVYGTKGEYIMTRRGDANSVRLSILDYRKLRNAVVTHNHPSGGSFSFQDIRFLKEIPISELRVSTVSGAYYLRKPAKWPQEINSSKKIAEALEQIRKELKPKYIKLYNDGVITKSDRHKMFTDEVNKIFAERYGLEYGNEPYE